MAEGEFSLIQQYFAHPSSHIINDSVLLGIGDDAAVIQVPENRMLVQTIDTLIAGRHFPESTSAGDIAYKSLAVNVSDLAAMAATPWCYLLSLTLPEVNHDFLSEFSSSLFDASAEFGIQLIGGDTCKGQLSITIQASGHVTPEGYVTRKGARVGDRILLSGNIGSAALGLSSLLGRYELDSDTQTECLRALNRPLPRIDLIQLLGQYASSAIDISDGLASDLGHILQQSGVGALIQQKDLPVTDLIRKNHQYQYALGGGDDYQIVFTVAKSNYDRLMDEVERQNLDITDIGEITEQGFWLQTQSGRIDLKQYQGFNHFVE
jgi:thiamine-monophosphate kinase